MLLRLAALYLVIGITQIIFYFYNKDIIGVISISEITTLFRGSFIFNTISIIYANGLFIVLSLLPLRARSKPIYQKILFWLYLIINTFSIIVLNLMDVVYFHYAQKRITAEEFHFTQNDNTLPIFLDYLWANSWLIFVGIFCVAFIVFIYKKIPYYPSKIKKSHLYYPVHAFLFCFLILVSLGGARGGFNPKLRPYNLCNAAWYTQTPQQAHLILSNPFCLLRTIELESLQDPKYFEEEKLSTIYTPYHYPKSTLTYELGKRNIIIFILESFSKEHSKFYCPELYRDSEGYTPFLDSLMQKSYTFTNAFSNGMKSIEALPSILTSIPSYQKPFVMMPQSLGKLEGLPYILSQEGYSTSFFCGTERNSMFFEAYASMAGVETFYAKEDYEKVCPVNGNTIEPFWGVYDMPFYQFMADKLKDMRQPFFTAVFNLTSHHPYTLPADYVDKMPKGYTKVQPCVAYTDLSLRKLFERIQKEPWYNNSIFVFVADHASPEIYAPQTRLPKGKSAIFYFIFTPDKAIQGIDTHVTQQLDIMPTLLGLIGYKIPYFAFGRDVFNERNRFPMATNYINELYQCITDSVTIYMNDNEVISAFTAADLFQKKNIVNENRKSQQEATKQLKALIQSYYNHVSAKNYKVKE
ncbi:MAG: sulfatase-like hydrolase/transferase [Bacteroidales bacterium]|nr:sulfatase-like hydrolase/transferase [Bacteroidales bacterium]